MRTSLAPSFTALRPKRPVASTAARASLPWWTTSIATVAATGISSAQAAEAPEPVVHMEAQTVEGSRLSQLASPKFTAPLVDTPQTVTVIPQRIMEEQAATSLRDILRNSPGITFQAGEGGTPAGDQMTIRGFSARTDLFVDGVRDLGGYSRDSFNLEQVEIAKGPSSASGGRGSTGGSVNLVTKTPHGQESRNAVLALGTDAYQRATLDINQPLGDGADSGEANAAVRVNALWQDAEVPGRDVVANSSWGLAPSFAFGLRGPTKVTVAYQHLTQDNVPDYGLPRQTYSYEPPVPYSNWYGLRARDYEKIEQDLGTVTVEHQSLAGYTLRNLTRVGRTYRDSVITAPRFISGSTDIIRRSDWKSRDQTDEVWANQTSFTQEIETGAINHGLNIGLELTRERENNANRIEDPATVLPDTDVYTPNPDDAYTGSITRDGAFTEATGDTAALYAFDNIFAGKQWQLFLGLRYDVYQASQDVVAADASSESYERTDRELSGRVGAVYKPTPNSSLYAGYANSFNPSAEGLSLTTRGGSLEDLAPEKTDSYEIGAKWDAVEGRLALAAALFRTEKTNARTAGIDPSGPPTVLDGRERVDGIELSAAGKVTAAWEVFAGLSLMESKILETNDTLPDAGELGLTPKRSFNLWTTYRLPGGLTLGGGANYLASVFRNDSSGETVPSYLIYNGMISYAVSDTITLRLNATNITDEEYVDRVGGGHHIPGQARQFILTTQISF